MSLDLTQHVEWSSDDDYYYATVELRTPDGQLGTVEVRVDRPWVIQTAQAVRKRLLATAPAGVDVGAWKNPSDPARFVKLCQHIAGEEVKRQITEQVKRDGIVIAPWFGEWTTATADAAYRLVQAAQAGDDVSVQQLERIRECAEIGDPAAAKALGMINSVAKLVARNLPPPSVVATRVAVEGGALPPSRLPVRRQAVRTPPRALPPRRPVAPKTDSRRGAAAAPTRAPSGVTGPRGATPAPTVPTRPTPSGVVAPLTTTVKTAAASPLAMARPSLVALRPIVTTLVPKPLAPAMATPQPLPQPLYNPWAQSPYGTMPMMPGDFGGGGGGGGGGYGGDLGPDDFLAPEEDNGAGNGFDEDDGTYQEDEGPPEDFFAETAPHYAIGDFPEELAQSESEDDDDDGPEGADPEAVVEAGGKFPGEGAVGGA